MSLRYDPYAKDEPGPQIGLVRLAEYVTKRWRAENLGIYSARNVRGGTARSLHAEGRAFDCRLASRDWLDELFATMIANADLLSIQAVHDYERGMRWRVDRGWGFVDIGTGAPGHTTHIERNWDGARDHRAVADVLVTDAKEQAVAKPYTAKTIVPWLPRVKGKLPKVLAHIDKNSGHTWVTGLACKLEPGLPVFAGCTAKDLGVLNAPIDELVSDVSDKIVVGLADDLGEFVFHPRAL